MVKKAEDSLESAKLLFSRGFYEFAAARAYYTMFYIAEALLLKENLSFSKHSAVISAFGKHFVLTNRVPKELHQHFIEAQECRTQGDYLADPGITEDMAQEQITRAEKFLELVDLLQ